MLVEVSYWVPRAEATALGVCTAKFGVGDDEYDTNERTKPENRLSLVLRELAVTVCWSMTREVDSSSSILLLSVRVMVTRLLAAGDDPVAYVDRHSWRGRYGGSGALDMHVAGERGHRAGGRLRHRSICNQ